MTQLPKMGTVQPVTQNKPLKIIPNIELIGINDLVEQNKFGASKTINIANIQVSGEIIGVTLVTSFDGGGAILKPAVDLFFFRSDPSISVADDALTIAAANASEGYIHIAAADYAGPGAGTDTAALAHVPVAFGFQTDSIGNLYVAMVNRATTTINSDAGDDEQVEITLKIRLDD